ncbi:hypothetical protein D3C84_576010 [compost metagenome]
MVWQLLAVRLIRPTAAAKQAAGQVADVQRKVALVAVRPNEVETFFIVGRGQNQKTHLAGNLGQGHSIRGIYINAGGDGYGFLFKLGVHHLDLDGFDITRADDSDSVVRGLDCGLGQALDDFLLLAFVQLAVWRVQVLQFEQAGLDQVMHQQFVRDVGRRDVCQFGSLNDCFVFGLHRDPSVLGDALKLRLLSRAQVGVSAVTLEAGADIFDELQLPAAAGV